MMQDFSTFLQQRWHSWLLKNEHIFYNSQLPSKKIPRILEIWQQGNQGRDKYWKCIEKYIVESLEVRIISCPAPNA